MRRLLKVLAIVVGVIIVVDQIIDTVLMVWAFRRRSPRALAWLTWYHKHVTNPVMVRFFSGRSAHAALLHHVGRRSGRAYATPVTAHRSEDTIIVPLPYGTDVDWLRNLRAAGEGVVKLEGRSFTVDAPEVVPVDQVMALLPSFVVRIIQLHDTKHALRLHVARPAERLSA
jgi:deazaflavin-dependent oxidoreductase (nitroreductase family)